MAVKRLDLIACVRGPNFAGFVRARGNNLVTLRVELDLTDLVLVSLKNCNARSGKHIVNSRESIGTGSSKFVSSAVEACVKYFVVVTSKSLYALALRDVPQLTCSVNAASEAVVPGEIKLSA